MPRLLPCPSCGRHIQVTEHECPFCGHGQAIVAAPSRLSVALLGLSLVACTGDKPEDKQAPAKSSETPSEIKEVSTAPEPEPPSPEPGPEPEPVQPAEPEPVAAETTGAEPGEPGSVGTTDGSATEEPKPEVKPVPKPKYGAPRPTKKYGAPPPPPKDPW